jgi:hypothetical protein
MFRRYPFTLGVGFGVVLYMLLCFLFFAAAFFLHWESHTEAEKSFMCIASFFGAIPNFIPSLFWTHNPLDPHSIMPSWYRPLTWAQGFIIGAVIDAIRYACLQSTRT